ncbi:hypothetical protein HHI36_019877 [Cryptolaemus montrouzieri]|uniref:Palmitoyl-protein thioesterase 1 n=1 Tax=Cryptolaemus montrouzieri TaxID=559131 RepID=A0ABD2N8N3_9CUCU
MNKGAFCFIACLWVTVSSAATENDTVYTPVVLWHGMGDTCCYPFSIGGLKSNIEKALPGIYVVSLKIGKNIVQDLENGYFMHPNKQVEFVCDQIKANSLLAEGFNAVGFSQGSQFLRALVQRCPEAKMKKLITLGGQHQGVYGLPDCAGLNSNTCDYIRRMLNHAAYYGFVQNNLVQATYWHDPLNEDMYKKYSTFLSDINNELSINDTYRERLINLDKFAMVKFLNDTVVQPVESEWFGFYEPGQAKIVMDLRSSAIYEQDRLGLKQLDEQGKLDFIEVEGDHLQFSWPWFKKNIVDTYLSD